MLFAAGVRGRKKAHHKDEIHRSGSLWGRRATAPPYARETQEGPPRKPQSTLIILRCNNDMLQRDDSWRAISGSVEAAGRRVRHMGRSLRSACGRREVPTSVRAACPCMALSGQPVRLPPNADAKIA
ncbi:hypothetical protein GCM10008170_15440 [Methylopila capsulata]|uniref:Uncharacterized protein n=1 Tax=Methylopila capsulata TaxID=61654 RepID=A0A9W6MRB0_9HYPH|nr:hypothetical protein GCM10008170_15440 [Methylopila capsulata]